MNQENKSKEIQTRASEKVTDPSGQKVLSEDKMSTKKKILVVDDEPSIRKLAERYLGNNGYEIITASNGKEGLEKFKETKFDLVITDLRMPVMDGFQLFGEVKKMYPEVKICLMTGMYDASKIEHMLKNGAKSIIKKPFLLEQFKVMVDAVLSEKTEEIENQE